MGEFPEWTIGRWAWPPDKGVQCRHSKSPCCFLLSRVSIQLACDEPISKTGDGCQRNNLSDTEPAFPLRVSWHQVGHLLQSPFSIEALWRSLISPPHQRECGQCLVDSGANQSAGTENLSREQFGALRNSAQHV